MVEGFSHPQVINSIQKAFSGVTTALKAVEKQMQKPTTPGATSESNIADLTKNWIQKRDRRNQQLMRDFLKTSIPRNNRTNAVRHF